MDVEINVGVIVLVTPPTVTVILPKSLVVGLEPKLTPAKVALCVFPKFTPAGFPTVMTASFDKATLLICRPLAELIIKLVPLRETVKSLEPSAACNCVCRSLAKSVKVAVAGLGVIVRTAPPTVTVKVLKSLVEALVPKLTFESVAMDPTVVSVLAVPVTIPGFVP